MTVKERILEAISALPDDARLEDVIEAICFMLKVEMGIEQLDAGQSLTPQQIRERMARWTE